MINWANYRKEFPHLKNQLYFNHAAISPFNLRAKQALDRLWENRISENIGFWPEALEVRQNLKNKIGKLINAAAAGIALLPNTSAGMNVLATGLQWKKGDRILLNDFEFPANVIPFMNLRRLGVEIDFVAHREGKLYPEDFLSKITGRTRVLSISFVEFLNGFRNDLASIGKICRENNIIFSVDAIQGLGALALDAEKLQIDFLASGGHKWLMWPAGLGFVYISPKIFELLHPAQAGWLSVKTPWNFFDYNQEFAPDAKRFEGGTFNTSSIIAAEASLDMMLEIGPARIEQKILQNSEYLINRLQEAGCRLFSDTRPRHRSGIVTFYHSQAKKLFEFLKKRRVTVSLREGKIRVAPHFYNDEGDLERLFELLAEFERNLK